MVRAHDSADTSSAGTQVGRMSHQIYRTRELDDSGKIKAVIVDR